MKGLGRNIKFMTGTFLKLLVRCYLVLAICWVVFWSWRMDLGAFVSEEAPFFVLVVSLALILISAMSYSDMYCSTMVSQGSARKPAALGMLLSQYIFLGMQLAILLVMTILSDGEWSLAVRTCPMGLLAVMFIIQGVGIICATLSMSGHNAWALVLLFGFIVACVVAGVMIGFKHDFVWSADMLKPYNSWLLLAAGVVMDLVGAVAYFKTIQKVDLKLA